MRRGLDGIYLLFGLRAVFKPRRGLVPLDFGGHSEGETPLPIPNRVVKPLSADGTWWATAWESRSPPGLNCRSCGEWAFASPRRCCMPSRMLSAGDSVGRRRPVEDYSQKYKGEHVELALFGGEYQDGVLTAYCLLEDIPHVELNGHILVPLQNVASLHCTSRCDAPEGDWPPSGLRDDAPE